MDQNSRIRIKLGPIEVEFEGSEPFLKDELPALLNEVSKLYKDNAASISDGASSPPVDEVNDKPDSQIQGTTGAFAGRLKVDSGQGLILAACAHLAFVKNKKSFARKEIIEEMKTATSYHKATYVNNLSKYLNGLVKDQKLNEVSKDTYALNISTLSDLEQRLA